MKLKLFFAALLCAGIFSQNLSAQTAADQAAVLKTWDAAWKAYEANDEAKMWSFYTPDACEVYPDGNSACGLANIKAGYEQFKTMMDGTPSWTMTPPTLQFISPDVCLMLSDVTSDIKLKGVGQVGGKSKFAAVLKKTGGQWLFVFDSQTPVMPMPEAGK